MELPRIRRSSLRIRSDSPTARDLRVLNEFAVVLLQPTSLADLLWVVAEKVGTVLGYEDCVVYLRDGDRLTQAAAYGVKNPEGREIEAPITIAVGQGVVGMVAATGTARIVDDVRSAPEYIADVFAGRSELTVPICFEGRVIGIIDAECTQVNGFSEADLELVEWIANIAAARIASALADRACRSAQTELRDVRARLDTLVSRRTDELTALVAALRGRVAAQEQTEADLRAETRRLIDTLANNDIQQKTEHLDALGRLASGLAQDLNNILTSIRGNLALVQQEAPADAEIRAAIEAASHECDRAGGLSAQFVALSRGGTLVITRAVPFEGLVRRVAARAQQRSGAAIQFDIQMEPAILVDIDVEQVSNALLHLFVNACQAMPRGGRVEVRAVTVAAGPGDLPPAVVVAIRDQGCGVAPTDRARIFDPSFTTGQGAGLGLTIAQRIVARHGGSLELRHTLGQGAEFALRLPLSCDAGRGERPILIPLPSVRQPMPGRPAHILVMDDEVGICSVLERTLGKLGHRVTTAASGESAVEEAARARAAGDPLHLALMDLSIPGGMDGRATLQHLRRVEPGLPAIVMSGYFPALHELIGGPDRFQAALQKPFGLHAVRDIVDGLLAQRSDHE